MWLILFRVFIVALLAHAGYVYTPVEGRPWAGLALGLITAVGLNALEMKMRTVSGPHLVGALVGGVTGLLGARLVWGALLGLDIVGERERIQHIVNLLRNGGIPVCVFTDPDLNQIKAAHKIAVDFVELHTGRYANATRSKEADTEFDHLRRGGSGSRERCARDEAATTATQEAGLGAQQVLVDTLYGSDQGKRATTIPDVR